MDAHKAAASEALRAAPPVTVTLASFSGMDISTWVSIATLIYVVLQIGLLIPKYRTTWGRHGSDAAQ